MSPYEGDPTDFSSETRKGYGTGNDLMSYYVSAEESANVEFLISVNHPDWDDALMLCRPYIRKVICSLGTVLLVNLKQGVNLSKIRSIVENYNGSVGPNRKVTLA